jgi:hypothetical protein
MIPTGLQERIPQIAQDKTFPIMPDLSEMKLSKFLTSYLEIWNKNPLEVEKWVTFRDAIVQN